MKIYGIARTSLYWALTALVIIFASAIAEIEVLRYFIGALMIFYGVEEIIYTALKNSKHYSINSLYWNIIEIVIGVTLSVFVETGEINVTYAVVCVGWAIWSILRESRELVEATEELKENKLIPCKTVAVVNLLESLTVIALSLTMLIEPGEHHAKIHLYLLAVELFTKVLFPIINYIAERLAESKKVKVATAESVQAEAASGETGQTEPLQTEPQTETAQAALAEAALSSATPSATVDSAVDTAVNTAVDAPAVSESETTKTQIPQ